MRLRNARLMKPTRDLPPKAAVTSSTLRQIAEVAGVSAMTVSRALGNRPRISEETRRRILGIAEKLGYRPDPELSKLMHHLRGRKRPSFKSVICGVTTRASEEREAYSDAIERGARRQAEARGHGFMLLRLARERDGWIGVQRILSSRGVQGVLFLPQREPVDLSALLDWGKFSVVAATSSVIAPVVHRVTPHHFENALSLCRNLAKLGYRRLGLVIGRAHDLRVNHLFSAAVTWHGLNETAGLVPPFLFERSAVEGLVKWFKREQPDVIIATEEAAVWDCARILRLKVPGRVGFASTNIPEDAGHRHLIGGMDEAPEEIGAAAADLLADLIERRVHGLPGSPASTSLAGRWRPGLSCPERMGARRGH